MTETPELWTEADLLAEIGTGGAGRPRIPLIAPIWHAGFASLTGLTEAQLMATLGIRRRAARRLHLAFALHRRLLSAAVPERPILRQPEDVAAVMRPLVQLDHERLWCLPLDVRRRLIGVPIEVARGDVDGTEASVRAVCRAALRAGAAAMIVVHNHPTGDPSPSPADVAVTCRFATAGRAIDVLLSDHVVVCADGQWRSLRRDYPECFR